MNSSVKKFVGSQGTEQAPEESGWTQYLEDFSSSAQREHSSYSNGSPSLVSDAASPTHGAWKMSNNKEIIACSTLSGQQFPKKLNVKKQTTKKYYCHDLEDTASSPVNSPKVSSLKQMEMNQKRSEDSIGNFLGKNARPHPSLQSDERSSINFDGNSNDYMDLKKRGLCLMPFSTFVNYLG